MEWTSSSAGDDQKGRCTKNWNQIERQKENKFDYLAEGKRTVNCCRCWFPQHLDRIRRIEEEESRRGNKVD